MRNKNRISRMTKNYFKVPANLFDLGLHSDALSVAVFMLKCSEAFDPSVRMLARRLRLGYKAIRAAIEQLLQAKVIVAVSSSRGHRNKYAFNRPELWVSVSGASDIVSREPGSFNQSSENDYG